MKDLGYGKEYKYSHDYANHFVNQNYLPEEIKNERFWKAQENPAEQRHAKFMNSLWGETKK